MRTLAIGDIHGNYDALIQCLSHSRFDHNKDELIVLGDVYDGFPYSAQCVEELRKIENLIWVKGNHDEWVRMWLENEWEDNPLGEIGWLGQGGQNSVGSYLDRSHLISIHREFIKQMVNYYIDSENRLFVHAGINWNLPINKQRSKDIYYWDRLTYTTISLELEQSGEEFPYKEVFIGHTDTSRDDPSLKPVKRANLWNLDQGAGWAGKLTIMDVDTHEYWQSDMNKETHR